MLMKFITLLLLSSCTVLMKDPELMEHSIELIEEIVKDVS